MNIVILLMIILLIALTCYGIFLPRKGADNGATSADIRLLQDNVLTQTQKENAQNRQEIEVKLNRLEDKTTEQVNKIQQLVEENLEKILAKNISHSFTLVNEKLTQVEQRSKNLEESTKTQLTSFGETIEKKFASLQESNEKRLKEIQGTVDEQLQDVLRKRINESFSTVNDHLEKVQKGLGEMRNLAQDVGGLKTALTGVKTRGIIGEMQLARILEDVLTPNQYIEQARIIQDSQEQVDFAIKLPGKSQESPVYLPIDSKLPLEDYQRLVDAMQSNDTAEIERSKKALYKRVEDQAKNIAQKYIQPPQTTDFGIIFLASEGLYAEIVQNVALTEKLNRDYKINVAGPSTITALLNSLQMGFKTLAIEQRSSEVWETLSAVKTEFGKFGAQLEKVHKKIQETDKEMNTLIFTRTNVMNRKLKEIETLDDERSMKILEIEE